ncbi:MAG: MarR family winged helix-turn-helix transcriptional regulator [Anaeromyxobacteraceae bacterium]
MQEYLGVLIAAARRRIKQLVLARVSHADLTPQQFWALIAVREHPGISQARIAARVRADAPSVSRSLAALQARGLVRTEADPEDRRRACVFLTAAGKRLVAQLAPVAAEVREAVVAGMSPAEIAAVRAGLERIISNLDRLAGDRDARERA